MPLNKLFDFQLIKEKTHLLNFVIHENSLTLFRKKVSYYGC
jgi:hypothetical protein